MKNIGILYLGRKGGATVDTFEICKSIINNTNNSVFIVLSKQIDNISDYCTLQQKNPDRFFIYFINTYNSKLSFLIKSLNFIKFISIANLLKKKKLDFIYLPMITYWGALITLFLKKQKIVTAIHDPEMHIGESDLLFSFLTKQCVKKSNYVIVFAKKFIKKVSEKYSFSQNQICDIKLGGYNYYKQDIDTNYNTKEKNNKILFFGRISEYKGLKNLLEAMKIIKSQGLNIILKVVGSGRLSEQENQLINELGTSVELVNRWIKDEEVESFFYDIDFTVLPYIEATQSGIVMLSYAMQKPVLATDVGAFSEQVIDGETGLLIEPNDVMNLVNGIKKMYINDSFIEKGQKAYYYATQEWTWKKQVEKLLEFIE